MLIGAAFYRDRYRRTADGWKICAHRLRPHLRRHRCRLEALNFKLKAWSRA